MPEPTAILEGLGRIVERFGWLAIAWHVVLAAAFILLLAGLRPSRRLGALLLTLPLVSVAVLAFTNGNPFNGIVFAAFAVVLSAIGVSLPAEKSRSVEGWALGVGIVSAAIPGPGTFTRRRRGSFPARLFAWSWGSS
jgi:hypothetical protein